MINNIEEFFFVTVLDFDECQSPDSCGDNHVCNNTVGSYRCECPIGFVADSGAQDPGNSVCVGKMLIHVFMLLVTIFGRRIEKFDAEHHQAPVFQKVDSAIHRINHYPLNSAIGFPNAYLMDSAIHLLNKEDQGMGSVFGACEQNQICQLPPYLAATD